MFNATVFFFSSNFICCFVFYFMNTAADLSSIRAVFNEKEKELSLAAAQVEELTRQLEQFSLQAHHAQAHPGSKAYFVQLHLERLRAELMVTMPYIVP